MNDVHWNNILCFCVYGDWCPFFSGRGALSSTGGAGPVYQMEHMGAATEEVMKLFYLNLTTINQEIKC